MFFKDFNIRKFIESLITKNEDIKERGSGSGHKAYVSVLVESYDKEFTDEGYLKIDYSYRKIIETEFTSFPDNPPHEYLYTKSIIIDHHLEIIQESDKKLSWTNFDIDTSLPL